MKKSDNNILRLYLSIILCVALITSSCSTTKGNQFVPYLSLNDTGFSLGEDYISNLEKTFDMFYIADNNTIEIDSLDIRWDDTRIQNDVSIALATHSDNSNDTYDCSFDLKDVILSRETDGRYYYIYSIEVTKTARNENDKGYIDLIYIAVLLK